MRKREPSDAVRQAWKAFEKALSSHSPETLECLQPGCQDTDLTSAEKRLGFALPPEVRTLYLAHNGAEGPEDDETRRVFAVCDFLPLSGTESAVAEHGSWKEMCADSRGFQPKLDEGEFDREAAKFWLPFAKDYAGNCLLVSCRPNANGEPGEVLRYDHENAVELKVIAGGLAEFLKKETRYIEEGIDAEHLINYDDDYRYLDASSETEDEEENVVKIDDIDPFEEGKDLDEDEDMDEDEGDDEDFDDDDSLEVTVQLPGIKTRPVGAVIQTATMKEMDAVVEIVKPTVAGSSVSVMAYTGSDPKKPLLEEGGGDVEISEVYFLVGDEPIEPAKSQLTFETVKKGGGEVNMPVLTWIHEESLTDDVGLTFCLRKPR